MTIRIPNAQLMVVCLLYLGQVPGAFSQSGGSPIEILKAYDKAFQESYTLRCQSVAPASFREREVLAKSEVTLTGNGQLEGFRQVIKDLSWSNLDASIDAASRTMHYVWHTSAIIDGASAALCDFCSQIDLLYSDGTFANRRNSTPWIDICPVKHSAARNIYARMYPFLLILGRGYGSLLDEVLEYSEDSSSGVARLKARGRLFTAPMPGENGPTWEIEIDLRKEYLVRSATYSYEVTQFDPIQFVPNLDAEVVSPDSLPLWKEGSLVQTGKGGFVGDRKLNVTSYTREPDHDMLKDVAKTLGIRLFATHVRDHRFEDGDGNPLVIDVR